RGLPRPGDPALAHSPTPCVDQWLCRTPAGHHPARALAHPVPPPVLHDTHGDAADARRVHAVLQRATAAPRPPVAWTPASRFLVGCGRCRELTTWPTLGRTKCQHLFES